jgi:acyl-CoA thioester hydrolase
MSEQASPPFRHRMRVYWQDTDAGGVVYHANYLTYFERARTEWLRALGFNQLTLMEEAGAAFVVAEAQVRYLRPARLDDEIDVTVALQENSRSSLMLAQHAWRGDELLTEGAVRLTCVGARTFKPQRIPTYIIEVINPSAARPDAIKPDL